MTKYARFLLLYSFTAFLFVFLFGLLRSVPPVKALFSASEAQKYTMLFHSHFDQLCWLGAAAVGGVFYYFREKYQGSFTPVKIFTYCYMIGTLAFSLAFLARAVGYATNINAMKKLVFIVLVSLSGLLFLTLIGCGIYILTKLMAQKE